MDDKKDIVDRLMLKSPLHNLTSYELVEAANEITRLRKERDEARRQVCKDAGILRSVYVDPDQDINEWANYIAKVNKWDCFKENT